MNPCTKEFILQNEDVSGWERKRPKVRASYINNWEYANPNSWAVICVERNLILKLRWNDPIIGKLFLQYGDFLIQVYHKMGCEFYIEKVIDGVLIFYKSVTDFVKCHELAIPLSIPESLHASTPRNKNGHIELYVEVVRMPPNVNMEEIMLGVTKAYQILSKDIKVERLSKSSGVIHYGDAANVEAILENLMKIWDLNREDASLKDAP